MNAMKKEFRPLFTLALLAAAAFSAAAQDASGQPADERLDPVQINAQRHHPVTALPRYDVQRSCPDYGETLKTSLARSLRGHIDQEGEMLVSFELQGKEIAGVKTQGGPFAYRSPVRRAVSRFDCTNDGLANQNYMFKVVFKLEEGTGDDSKRVAVQSGPQVLALASN